MASVTTGRSPRPAIRATACPYRGCPARGVTLQDHRGQRLLGVFVQQEGRTEASPITSVVFGVPESADLGIYKDFTHLYLPAPTGYLVPHQSWILLRHQGLIRHAKRVEWATYNEKGRRSDDPSYGSNKGSKWMSPGHVVAVGPSVPVRRAFRWIDPRHGSGLAPGSIRDPQGGEPFHWQLAMVVRTKDRRRQSARPFTVIRRSDLIVPASSSRPERELRDGLMIAGAAVCRHLTRIRLPDRSVDPDITIPELRTVIEYDGAHWHHGAANHQRDIRKSASLLSSGWKVIRVREPGLTPLSIKRRGFRQWTMADNTTSQEQVMEVLRGLSNI